MGEARQITLSIDGQYIQVGLGTSIIEAARRLDIFIPTLCYHESLKEYSSCRLCIVEVIQNKRSKLVTSCNYPAEEGIEVLTNSDKVRTIRKTIVESLLARCPNVPLFRKLAEQMDIKDLRFKKQEEHLCMLCGLCVRVCEEMVGIGALGFVNRGTEREVGTPFAVDSDVCIGCGACSFICPTGCIEMVAKKEEPDRRYMKMGDLSLSVCPNGYQCEACEVEKQFLGEIKGAIAEFRSKLL